MKKTSLVFAALWPLAAALSAADLQDWSRFEPNMNVGSYADDAGGKVEISRVEGPAKGQQAVRITADLVKWGGLWSSLDSRDLSKAGGLKFKAKAATAGYLQIGLTDAKRIQVNAIVRVLDGGWQDFSVPMSLFKKADWQHPDAPKDGVFDPSAVTTLNLSPRSTGKSEFTVGPLAVPTGKVEGRTGMMDGSGKDGVMMVQDFESLDAGAYGTFQDEKGSRVKMSIVPGDGGKAAEFAYDVKDGGWGGAWMRAGDVWGGQDWTGAKRFSVRVHSSAPLAIELAFNDANQNAYVAPAAKHDGKGWQELTLPFDGFKLNEWYQPPQAKKGAALDLSRIETFNLSAKDAPRAEFKVDDVKLMKK